MDARVVAVDGRDDEVMLYATQTGFTDYEIVIVHIDPIDEVHTAHNGYYAGK